MLIWLIWDEDINAFYYGLHMHNICDYWKHKKCVRLFLGKTCLWHVDFLVIKMGSSFFLVVFMRMEHKSPYSNGYHLGKNNYAYSELFNLDVILFDVIQVVFVMALDACSHKWSICICSILVLCSLLGICI